MKPRVLCVDDEPFVLESLEEVLRRSFDVRIATSGMEGLALLTEEPDEYAVVVSDMRMPEMSGNVFLREARRVAPDAARILLTGQADLQAAVSAVNDAQLFRFLLKPCEPEEIIRACAGGLSHHRLHTAERVLLQETLKGSVQALADVLALSSPAAFGSAERVKGLVARLAQALAVDDAWEVEIAALLAQIGAITLPPATAEKLYAGQALSEPERAMVIKVPAVTRAILGNIPRLDGVLAILDRYDRPFSGGDGELPRGSRMLRVALDYDRLEAGGATPDGALAAMAARTGAYDPEILNVLTVLVGGSPERPAEFEIGIVQLKAGMRLEDDVRSENGSLLVARGQPVTDQLIDRLVNLGRGAVREPILVSDGR